MQTPPVLIPAPDVAVGTGSFVGDDGAIDGDPFAAIFARLLTGNLPNTTTANLSVDIPANLPTNLPTTGPTKLEPAAPAPGNAPTLDIRQLERFIAELGQLSESLVGDILPSTQPTKAGLPKELVKTPTTDGSIRDQLVEVLTSLIPTGEISTSAGTESIAELASLLPTTEAPAQPIVGNVRSSLARFADRLDRSKGLTADPSDELFSEATQARRTGERQLQPFQPFPFTKPRYVEDPLRNVGDSTETPAAIGSRPITLESLLGQGRPGRIVVDRDVLRALDQVIGRQQPKSDIIERGASVLTPDELKQETSTVEDRNATALARVDRQEFIDRVLQALDRARAQLPKKVEIELNPPSLGKLRVQVVDIDGQLTAKIEVQSSATRSLLLDNLPTLDRNLGEHGVQIQRFQVDQTNTGSNGLADPNGQHNPHHHENPNGSGQKRDGDETENTWADSENGPAVTIADIWALADGMNRLI